MISLLIAALLFLNVSTSSSPTTVEQLTDLRQQANAAPLSFRQTGREGKCTTHQMVATPEKILL